MNRKEKHILRPPASIGIVGGGQLGRMLAMEAKRLGYGVVVLDPTLDCPAGQVSDRQILAAFSDTSALLELAETTEVITYEFEHIDAGVLKQLEAKGYEIYPSPDTLRIIQNKYDQKSYLKDAGLPVPLFYKVESREDIIKYMDVLGVPLVLKTCTGGYDGKGNMIIKSIEDINQISQAFMQNPLMVEQYIDYVDELSIMAARDANGSVTYFPVVKNVHEDSILRLTVAPADINQQVEKRVKAVAEGVLQAFSDIGLFCIEMFRDEDDNIYINEIAPRPHNSGHYTIEGCMTSQFEQLIRIITGMPMGSTKLICPCAMVNILGNQEVTGSYTYEGLEKLLEQEGVYPHLYGKHKTGYLRKIGHITVMDECQIEVQHKALEQLEILKIVALKEGSQNEG